MTTDAALEVVGREAELAAVDGLLREAADHGRGGALVISGDPGVGKSTLVAAAVLQAAARGMPVLQTTGAASEGQLAFAGLHQLLRGRLDRRAALPLTQRRALEAALGLLDDVVAERFLVALATLELLAEEAAGAPLLVTVDDGHWLDRASAEVLAFVARRVAAEPIVVLITERPGVSAAFLDAGLPRLDLDPLSVEAAGALLDRSAPALSDAQRERVLAWAAGNPLALVELPSALRGMPSWPGGEAADALPLTARLERTFATLVDQLPDDARTALLVAAAARDGEEVGVVLRAAGEVLGTAVGVGALDAAANHQLVRVDRLRVVFRHPLVRSAVYGSSGDERRRAAHAALAAALGDDERGLWHRSACAIEPDRELADELMAAAAAARRRGDVGLALIAVERAARLSVDRDLRTQRLLEAGELAFELGGADQATTFLDEVADLVAGPHETGRLFLLRELAEETTAWTSPERVDAVLEGVDAIWAAGDRDLAFTVLVALAQRCWWLDLPPDVGERLVAAVERFLREGPDPRALAVLAFADPIGSAAAVVAGAEDVDPTPATDAGLVRLLGAATSAVGAFDRAPELLDAAAAGLRGEGRLGLLAQALVSQAWTAWFLGDWEAASLASAEAGRLARETGQRRWAAAGDLVAAALAAARGEHGSVDEITTTAAEQLAPTEPTHPSMAFVELARGLLALSLARFDAATDHLLRIHTRGDAAYHPFVRWWVAGDLVEAGVRAGRHELVRPIADQLIAAARRSGAVLLVSGAHHAVVHLADPDALDGAVAAALTSTPPMLPFDRARVLLAHGERLRRQQRITEARRSLRDALAAFDGLGAAAWSERARLELRATGERSRRRAPDAHEQLSPQELQIARLAADGLTNREIGQLLYLSHRTVGSHLYRIFPKLGITSRAQLGARLTEREEPVT